MKKCMKIHEILFKNWKLLFRNTHQTPPYFSIGNKNKHARFFCMTTQLGPSQIAHVLENKGPNNSSSIIAQLLIKCPLSLVISL